MKFILTLLLLTSLSVFADEDGIDMPIFGVYDGDTIKSEFSWHMPSPLDKVSVRIYGINSPEMPAKSYKRTGKLGRAKCVKEAELALKAKARVVELTKGHKNMRITDFKWGKFGGRIIAKVYIGCINIADTLIKEGLAVEYYGKGKKQDWCQ